MNGYDSIEKFELFDNITCHKSTCMLFAKQENRFIDIPNIVICTRDNMDIPESYLLLFEDTEKEEKILASELQIKLFRDNIFIMHSEKYMFIYFSTVTEYVGVLTDKTDNDIYYRLLD